jgi:hypothetical protein
LTPVTDFRHIDEILEGASQTLDFSRMVAIMLIAILHLFDGKADPHGIVAKLVAAIPLRSYLAISHRSSDIAAAARAEATERLRRLMHEKQTHRSREEVASFFMGPEMVEPGLVRIPEWLADNEADAKSPSALRGGEAQTLTDPQSVMSGRVRGTPGPVHGRADQDLRPHQGRCLRPRPPQVLTPGTRPGTGLVRSRDQTLLSGVVRLKLAHVLASRS